MGNELKIKQTEALLIALAEYLRTTLSPEQRKMYAMDLAELSTEELTAGISIMKHQAPPYAHWYPVPAQIIEAVRGTLKDQAVNATNRIVLVLSRGNTGYHLAAAEYQEYLKVLRGNLGELAWATIKELGGWQKVCGEYVESKQSFLRNQLMTTCQSIQRLSAAGIGDKPPGLPSPVISRAAVDRRMLAAGDRAEGED